MTTSSRQTVREALGTLLTSAMTGSGKPVQIVYDYPKLKYAGASPLIALMSTGSGREPSGYSETQPRFYLTAYVFVLLSDPANNWTETDAEDAIDAIERLFSATLIANQETANWQNIQYSGRTTVDMWLIDGVPYLREQIPLLVECQGDE